MNLYEVHHQISLTVCKYMHPSSECKYFKMMSITVFCISGPVAALLYGIGSAKYDSGIII